MKQFQKVFFRKRGFIKPPYNNIHSNNKLFSIVSPEIPSIVNIILSGGKINNQRTARLIQSLVIHTYKALNSRYFHMFHLFIPGLRFSSECEKFMALQISAQEQSIIY